MNLTRLICKNFKKLSDFTADFTGGLNVICGENAQGKSTLLQAIEAALFGVTVVPGKKENLPTWGQTSFSVELHFHVAQANYALTRTKTSAKLVRLGSDVNCDELVANGNTPVTAYIEELLGLSSKDWNLFVQSRQGETAGVLTFGATALNQKVEEFAGVSLIDDVAKKAQDRASTARAQADSYSVEEDEMATAEAAVASAGVAEKSAEAAVVEAARLLQDVESETMPQPPAVSSAELNKRRRAADQCRAAYNQAVSEENAAAEALVVAETDLKQAELPSSSDDLDTAAKETKSDIAALKKHLAENRDLQQTLKMKAHAAEKAATEYATCEPVAEEVVDHARTLLANAAAEVSAATSRLAEHSLRRKSLESLAKDALCPTCGTQLSEHDPEKLKAEIAAVKVEEEKLLVLLVAGKKEVARLTACVSELEKVRDTYLRLKAAVESAEQVDPDELEALAFDQERLQGCLDIRQEELAAIIAKADTVAAVAARYASLERRVAQAEKRLAAASQERQEAENKLIDGPPDELIELTVHEEAEFEKARSEWQARRAEAERVVTSAEAELKNAQIRLKYAKQALETLQVRVAKAKQVGSEADKAGRLARFLRERRQAYLKEVWDGVLGLASRHVRGATGGLITKITNDGEFQFEEDGVLAPVSSASGAQKAFIGAALRIGLARALYGRDSLLIFDEPTESMSERNAAALAASLTGAGQQTLLITHREHDQSLAANLITIGA